MDVADERIYRAVRCSRPPPTIRKRRNVAAQKAVFLASDKPDPDAIAAVILQAVVGGQVDVEILEHFFRRARLNQTAQEFAVQIGAKGRSGKVVLVLFIEGAFLDAIGSNALHPIRARLNDRPSDPAHREFLFRLEAVFVLFHIE